MSSFHKKNRRIIWVISILVVLTLVIAVGSIIWAGLLGNRHYAFMLGAGVWLFILSLATLIYAAKFLQLQNEKFEEYMSIQLALISMIDLKDPYTEGHSINVRNLSRNFAEFLELPSKEIEEIAQAAELHDVGKIGIPDHILKKPGKLNVEEFQTIKKHPILGSESIKKLKGFEKIQKTIRHHHERIDGTGYPDGLHGPEIPLGSKIISIVDAYDGMIHGRAYRKALSENETLRIIESEKGSHFDPGLVDSFLKFLRTRTGNLDYDLVCGMSFKERNLPILHIYQEQKYWFCSEVCRNEFQQFPKKYIETRAKDRI